MEGECVDGQAKSRLHYSSHMQSIESHYALFPAAPVFHYTSGEGLCGILEKRSLWATHIRFLNDAREFHHATELAKSELAKASTYAQKKVADKLLELLGSMSGTTWVASFSEEGDLLSQWRAYCPRGGYSMAFAPDALRSLAEANALAFAKCIYERKMQETMISELVAASYVAASEYTTELEPAPLTEDDRLRHFAARWFFPRIQRLASLMKNPAFREEAEWRLIAGLYRPHITPDYRIRGAMVVPHRTLHFPEALSTDQVVTSVMIGPGLDYQQAEIGLFFLKQRASVPRLPVSQTAAPYRLS